MIKFYNTQIVFQEVPDEVTLAINLTNCPYTCPRCHSPYLRQDIGTQLTQELLESMILNKRGITCVCFLGLSTNQQEYEELKVLRDIVSQKYDLKTAWYTGQNAEEIFTDSTDWKNWDYIKFGRYVEALGGLDKSTTNQKLIKTETLL